MRTIPTIVEFATDPQLLNLSLSRAQEACLRATYALPLTGDLVDLYQACTGRPSPPSMPPGEVTVIAGARAGKDSRLLAPVIAYEAVFGDHERHLHRGERAMIPLIAQDARATAIS